MNEAKQVSSRLSPLVIVFLHGEYSCSDLRLHATKFGLSSYFREEGPSDEEGLVRDFARLLLLANNRGETDEMVKLLLYLRTVYLYLNGREDLSRLPKALEGSGSLVRLLVSELRQFEAQRDAETLYGAYLAEVRLRLQHAIEGIFEMFVK